VRLLLVHGTLSNYRLARLIKYSFFKNILFCFMLFFFQASISPQTRCFCTLVAICCFCMFLPASAYLLCHVIGTLFFNELFFAN